MNKQQGEKKVDSFLWRLANRKNTIMRVTLILVGVFVAGWFAQPALEWLFN